MNPNFVEAHRLRAQLHVKMGEIEGAIDILKGLLKAQARLARHSLPDCRTRTKAAAI